MINVIKKDEPEFWKKYKNKNFDKDVESSDKNKLKNHILEEEQFHCCVYCEKFIPKRKTDNQTNIEHTPPSDFFIRKYGTDTQYTYLTVSCNHYFNNCNNNRGNYNESDFIDPIQNNPKEFFTYNKNTGKIVPIFKKGTPDYNSTLKIINLLDLNNRKVVRLRMDLYKELKSKKKNKTYRW